MLRIATPSVRSLLAVAATLASLAAQGTPIGFEETWALATDRAKAVATLIPGSDDWYYWHCRERLDARDFATVRQVLPTWIQRHGRNHRVVEIENRDALLSAGNEPERAFALLKERLGLRFDHQRVVPGATSDLPTRLPADFLSPGRLQQQALTQRPETVDAYSDLGLRTLADQELTPRQLRSWLQRLQWPDLDNLPALIVRDLRQRNSGGFGAMPIHQQLRLAQLEECARLMPELLRQSPFVECWLARLAPAGDTPWQHDAAARTAHLERLWGFAQRLPASFNSLKAHVLGWWLRHDLSQGAPDKERFMAYLRLPRRSGPVAQRHLDRFTRADEHVNLGVAFATGLEPLRDDDDLVRDCLEHYFATEDSVDVYAEWLDARWLGTVLAETKLLLGAGDAERWTALLDDPGRLEQIKQRVEISFPPTLREHFGADDPVSLAVDVKNVPTLLVKVYAVDAFRYHVEQQKEVDATIELDGVVPTFEQTFTSTEPPLRRVRRTVDLPMLKEPGTWVVDFVGGGIASRAVVHKGSLRGVQRTAAAGHVVRVFDETGAPAAGAAAWLDGREYVADAAGAIKLPFTSEPGNRLLVLRAGNRSTLMPFRHLAERYELTAGCFVDREALVAGQTARLAVRPQLRLCGHDVSLALLQDRVLTIVATDLDGLATTLEVRDVALVDEREFVHELQVPERLQSLQIALRGKVKDLMGKDVVLTTATTTFQVNGIDATAASGAPLLTRTGDGYALDLRGKNGEALAGRACMLNFWHRDFRSALATVLQSDAQGRITLGALPGVLSLQVQTDGVSLTFRLDGARAAWPSELHGAAGTTLRLPYQGTAVTPSRRDFGLLGAAEDAFARLAIADGFLELRELPAGDYVLLDHRTGGSVAVRITAGRRDGDWLVGKGRTLAVSDTAPLHVRQIGVDGKDVVIRLANANADTRVHVVATRTQPVFDVFRALATGHGTDLPEFGHDDAASSYQSGRRLGDEFRYVLERRFARKFAGNMLTRPGLLLNPWQVDDSTNAAVGLGGGEGGRFGGRGRRGGPAPAPSAAAAEAAQGGGAGDGGVFASFDWLPRGASLLSNLAPDKDGVVRVDAAALGDGQHVHVLALAGDQAVYDTMVRPEVELQPRARTLARALDTTQHFIEQRRIEFVAAGATATLADAREAQVEIHDSLASVFRLMSTISRDGELAKFAFLLDWPQKSDADKLALYRQFACHELHFFLWQKDRAFFTRNVLPLLRQKLDKTFLDHWLCGDDLTRFTGAWEFAQLNLIERILLAQRLDAAGKTAVARSVREALELKPSDITRLNQLFDLALESERLAERDELRAGLAVLSQDLRGPADNVPRPGGGGGIGGAAGPSTGGPAGPTAGFAARAPGAPAPKPGQARDAEKDARPEGDAAAKTGSDDFYLGATRKAEELKDRGAAAQLFRAVERTKLLAESNWWRRRMAQSTPDVVAANRFWRDYAEAPAGQPFVSSAIVEANGSTLEMLMALAVLDLPFTAGKHEITADGNARTLKAATPLLLVRKEVTKAERAADQAPLLLGQNFFRLDDRYRTENGERRDAFVTDEFLVGVAYGCQVVVTNPTSSPRTAEVLLQIPAGAIPVQKGFWQKGVPVQLAPYATATVEYAFYFPAAGSFAHYPAHAAEKGRLAANAEPKTLKVVATPSKVDTTSWEHVSQQGTTQDVLTFLDGHNVQALDLSRLAWRMQDRAVFTAVVARLRARHAYEPTLWSYAVLHRDAQATREHLQHADAFLATCGTTIDSPLLTFEPKERRAFEHLELDPLVHPRAHQLGSQRVIGNQKLATQYRALLDLLGYHGQLTADDWLVVTYYLALQDRIEDALNAFAKVDATKVAAKIQYDYLAAWLCFFTGDTTKARTLAEARKDEPVPHWQQRFRDVLAHLDEAEGKTRTPTGEPTADPAAQAPALELAIAGQQLTIAYKNLAQCEVRYYELDVEFAFSAQPFAAADGSAAAFVRPNLTETRDLPKAEAQLAFPLPVQFARKNVLVEVRGGGLVRSRRFFANELDVRFLESFGQVAVATVDTKAPLAKAYVKVFARLPDGSVRFHKDGYTDLRGRFDYASLSDDPNATANRYAVLVLDEQRGAVIREIAPPAK